MDTRGTPYFVLRGGAILGCIPPVLSLIHYFIESWTRGQVVRTRLQDEVLVCGVASVLVKCLTAEIVTLHLPQPSPAQSSPAQQLACRAESEMRVRVDRHQCTLGQDGDGRVREICPIP